MFSLSPSQSCRVPPERVCSRVRARIDATLSYTFARSTTRRLLFSYFDEPTYFERVRRGSILDPFLQSGSLSYNQMEK